MGYIFDLDQTIVDSSIAEDYRRLREWPKVFSLIPRFKLYEGIDEIFQILHGKGEKICVATSSPANYCRNVLKQSGLRTDFLVCYHDTKQHKPHPAPILRAAELLGDNMKDIISIGDSEKDIAASNAAGVISCLALWGKYADNASASADYVFYTVDELKNYILYKNGGRYDL